MAKKIFPLPFVKRFHMYETVKSRKLRKSNGLSFTEASNANVYETNNHMPLSNQSTKTYRHISLLCERIGWQRVSSWLWEITGSSGDMVAQT